MLIYLDNCTFNRPFDDQKQKSIYAETIAKLQIQEKIKIGDLNLAWSYILDFENSVNPFDERRISIANWKNRAIVDTDENKSVLKIANDIQKNKIKAKDALHIACAIVLHCDFFITTDYHLIKNCYNFERIEVINPIDFLKKIKDVNQ